MEDSPARTIAAALRSHARGVLCVIEMIERVRWVVEPKSGVLVAATKLPIEPGDSVTLFVPDEGRESAQVHATATVLDAGADTPEVDRWKAYHLKPRGTFVLMKPEGFKLGGLVADPGVLDLRNPLFADEPRLIRFANSRRAGLASACERASGGPVEMPLCVGIDPYGLDVRTALGILRIEFGGAVAADAAACEERLRSLLV